MMENFERQYALQLNKILTEGKRTPNRTGIDTIALQHSYFEIDVSKCFPLIKGKKTFSQMALTEMLWFLQGRVDIDWLKEHGVKYWDSWADFKGTVGKSYGYQFRNFGGIDQVETLINDMLLTPTSRRLILNLWNVGELSEMTLPPCVMNYQFSCTLKENGNYFVDLHVLQRSADMFLGVPYDFMLVGWLIELICYYLNDIQITKGNEYPRYYPRTIHYTCNDSHIYVNHIEQVKQYLLNVNENKNQVIDGFAICTTDFNTLKNEYKSFNDFLKNIISSWDGKKYTDIFINKLYNDEYGVIKADVAI